MLVIRVTLVLTALLASLGVGGTAEASVARVSAGAAVGAPAPASRATAEADLRRAEELLSPRSSQGRGRGATTDALAPEVPPTAAAVSRGDATLALRDVALSRADLAPAAKERAERLLARPASDATLGNADVLVHYVASAYTAARGNAGYPQTVLDTATYVHDTYQDAGYREPEPDGTLGGDARLDIYLTNLGTTGAYGYCGSDEPARPVVRGRVAPRDRWAFCVLDDGYSEYPGKPTEVLQVTLAHEYFHAVQFAYDAGEDDWFMEGTAVWAEDELFDGVDDNVQYAAYSPLAGPRLSLDRYQRGGFRQYGTWLWFRWLSEHFPESQGGMPTIVRDLWTAADSVRGNVDKKYSLDALATVLKARGLPLPQAYAQFADANRRPTTAYSEAAANNYPVAPLAGTATVTRTPTTRTYRLDHLASATTRLVPTADQGRRQHLRLGVDMAAKARGSVAMASTYLRTGAVRTTLVKLDGRGNASVRLPFAGDRVLAVEVTLVNASRRYRDCYVAPTSWSCSGVPMDQRVPESLSAALVR